MLPGDLNKGSLGQLLGESAKHGFEWIGVLERAQHSSPFRSSLNPCHELTLNFLEESAKLRDCAVVVFEIAGIPRVEVEVPILLRPLGDCEPGTEQCHGKSGGLFRWTSRHMKLWLDIKLVQRLDKFLDESITSVDDDI